VVTIKTTNRWIRFAVALLLVFTSLLPLFALNKADAYTLPDDRFIRLSSSAGAANDVTYLVSFSPNQGGTTQNIGGMVVEFCSDTPLIGQACTAPVGFNAHAFTGDNTLVLANQVGVTDWAKNTTNATANRLVLSRTGGAQALDPGAVTTVSFEMGAAGASDGVTNPTVNNQSFYARILTFTTQVGAEQYASNDIDNSGANTVVDAGGIALSTAAQITITAKVPEKITFCVYTSAISNDCSGVSGTAITLGNDQGILIHTGVFTDVNTKFSLSTNALYGAVVRMKGSTLKTNPACSEAAGQTCSIDAIAPGPDPSAPGTEQFGMCLYESSGAGTIDPIAPYNHASCNLTTQTAGGAAPGGDGGAEFAFDNNNVTGTTSTYGHPIADTNDGATLSTTATLAFIGNITEITEPGIYTTTLTFIATGTF
jgi:hypothetical protein